jgi:hypothetical protein
MRGTAFYLCQEIISADVQAEESTNLSVSAANLTTQASKRLRDTSVISIYFYLLPYMFRFKYSVFVAIFATILHLCSLIADKYIL